FPHFFLKIRLGVTGHGKRYAQGGRLDSGRRGRERSRRLTRGERGPKSAWIGFGFAGQRRVPVPAPSPRSCTNAGMGTPPQEGNSPAIRPGNHPLGSALHFASAKRA